MSRRRTLTGFLVSPAIPALLVYLFELLIVSPRDAGRAAAAVALFGYLGTVILGVPSYLVLRWRNITGPGLYLFVGAMIGLMCYAAVFAPDIVLNWTPRSQNGILMLRNSAGFAGLGFACGLVAGLAFWAISVRRNNLMASE